MKLLLEKWNRFLKEGAEEYQTFLMDPHDFLVLTRGEGDAVVARADQILKDLGGFDKLKAGALSLTVKKCPGVDKVINHEGRARAMAAAKSEIKEYPVSINFIDCSGTKRLRMEEPYFQSGTLEAQFSSDTISTLDLNPVNDGDILGFGESVEIRAKDLRHRMRVKHLEKASNDYGARDFIEELNSQYEFIMPSGGTEKVKWARRRLPNGILTWMMGPEFDSYPEDGDLIKANLR